MTKRVMISIDHRVYDGLRKIVGDGDVARFLEDLVRPHLTDETLDQAYAAMAADRDREREALEWSEALIGDIEHAPG